MNFEVFCMDFIEDSLQVVQKEYFETYIEALDFKRENDNKYEFVSITPMNLHAELEMRSD